MDPGRTVAFANQKGGVGKTTTLLNLAAALAEKGHYPLLVDLDPQANLTSGVGVDPYAPGYSVADLLMEKGVSMSEVIIPCSLPGVKIAPAKQELANFDIRVADRRGRENLLFERIRESGEEEDFVFVDCPPSLNLLTVNALTAARWVIIPVQCYYYSLNGLRALEGTIRDIRDVYNPDLGILGVLATACETGTHIAQTVTRELEDRFGELLFRTVIRKSVRVAEAPMYGRSLLGYSPSHDVSHAYRELAGEFLARLR
ncbi:MAG: ParA family protein [Actinomycetota bacterium]|nr:ParA family protein [Actinomycetota bacterium]